VPDWQSSQAGPFDLWPTGLGFECFYGFIGGDTDQWHPAVFDGTKPVEAPNDPNSHLDADHFRRRGEEVSRLSTRRHGGSGTLSVDGQQVAHGRIERTIPVRFSLDETLDAGMDIGTPVVESYVAKMPFKFTGGVKKVVIELGKSGLAVADEKEVRALSDKAARSVE
jgi:hypothetical protein